MSLPRFTEGRMKARGPSTGGQRDGKLAGAHVAAGCDHARPALAGHGRLGCSISSNTVRPHTTSTISPMPKACDEADAPRVPPIIAMDPGRSIETTTARDSDRRSGRRRAQTDGVRKASRLTNSRAGAEANTASNSSTASRASTPCCFLQLSDGRSRASVSLRRRSSAA